MMAARTKMISTAPTMIPKVAELASGVVFLSVEFAVVVEVVVVVSGGGGFNVVIGVDVVVR